MNLYLYRPGESKPVMTIEKVVSYTDNEVRTEEGAVYGPFAEGVELSSKEDCSETLRTDWRRENHPELLTPEQLRADVDFIAAMQGVSL